MIPSRSSLGSVQLSRRQFPGLGFPQDPLLQGVSVGPSTLPCSFWTALHSGAAHSSRLLIPVQRPQSSQDLKWTLAVRDPRF